LPTVSINGREIKTLSNKSRQLFTYTESGYEIAVGTNVFVSQVSQEPFTLAYELHQAPTRVMVFPVSLEVVVELLEALRHEGYLDLRGPSVRGSFTKFLNDFSSFSFA
jgi:hypothetical protein